MVQIGRRFSRRDDQLVYIIEDRSTVVAAVLNDRRSLRLNAGKLWADDEVGSEPELGIGRTNSRRFSVTSHVTTRPSTPLPTLRSECLRRHIGRLKRYYTQFGQ
jgi:hypothetical protein